jgi:hypothetical protein
MHGLCLAQISLLHYFLCWCATVEFAADSNFLLVGMLLDIDGDEHARKKFPRHVIFFYKKNKLLEQKFTVTELQVKSTAISKATACTIRLDHSSMCPIYGS